MTRLRLKKDRPSCAKHITRISSVGVLALILLLGSCATPIPLKVNSEISEIGIALEFNDEFVPEPLRAGIENQFNDFIISHNASASKLRVYDVSSTDSADLVFRVAGYKPVTSGQNAAGLIVSAIGLIAVPSLLVSAESEYIFFFWYFPRTRSLTELHLRRNLNPDNPPWIPGGLITGGFLAPPDRQMVKHAIAYRRYFSNVVRNIEKQLAKR